MERLRRRHAARRPKEDKPNLMQDQGHFTLARAARRIQRNWRRFKERKAAALREGRTVEEFLLSAEDPFLKNMRRRLHPFAQTIGV